MTVDPGSDLAGDLAAAYARAERLLPHRLRTLPLAGAVTPRFAEDDTFTYEDTSEGTTAEGRRWWRVDPAAGTREPADPPAVDPAVDPAAEEARRAEVAAGASISPDGRWAAEVRDHDLWLRDRRTGEVQRITTDGTAHHAYATPPGTSANRVLLELLGLVHPALVLWSPDSTRLVTHRIDEREVREVHLTSAAPADGGPPQLLTWRNATVGDPHLPTCELLVVDVADGLRAHRVTPVAAEPLPLFYRSPLFGEVVWTPDGAAVLAVALDRSHRRGELRRIDPATGACEVVLVEASQTWVSFAGTFDARPDVRLLADGRVLFWSERTGWGHLWLQEADGAQRPVTTGEWVVRELVAVDEAAGTAVVLGTGREPGGDPYLAQPYRVDLATGAVTRLCDEPADRLLHHHVVAAPSGRWLVDVASAVDVPTTSVLRDADGAVVMALSRCDPGPLAAVGWQPPERVRIPGVAGEDDLWGAIHLPPDFDPAQRYPVVEEVYAAPQMAVAPIAFPGAPGWLAGSTAPSIAALGFVVVVIDGRATPGRSRAFGTAGHGRPEGLPLEDHPAAIRHLAATRPWMDLDRVGVTGHSGGGYASTRLLLQQPDLYRAAVSTAGNHDETIYHAGWSDRFFGDVDHAARANARLADRLRGRLLLIHGELDDNVSPHQTLRLVDACMAADVDVDLLLVPGGDHMLNTHIAHWTRRRLDFLVAHVMGATPPAVRFAPIEPSLGGLAGLFA